MNPNKALWEKGDFTRIAESMRESGEAVVAGLGITRDQGARPRVRRWHDRPAGGAGGRRRPWASTSRSILSRPATTRGGRGSDKLPVPGG